MTGLQADLAVLAGIEPPRLCEPVGVPRVREVSGVPRTWGPTGVPLPGGGEGWPVPLDGLDAVAAPCSIEGATLAGASRLRRRPYPTTNVTGLTKVAAMLFFQETATSLQPQTHGTSTQTRLGQASHCRIRQVLAGNFEPPATAHHPTACQS